MSVTLSVTSRLHRRLRFKPGILLCFLLNVTVVTDKIVKKYK